MKKTCKVIKKRETDEVTSLVCDMCQRKARLDCNGFWAWDEINSSYQEGNECTILFEKRLYFSEDMCKRNEPDLRIQIDLCQKCFLGELVPYLKSKGARINIEGDQEYQGNFGDFEKMDKPKKFYTPPTTYY